MPHFNYAQFCQLKGLEKDSADEKKYTSEMEEINNKSMEDLFNEFGKDVLSMYTVVDLKEELKERKLSYAGKKSEMVDRLDEFFSKEGSNKKRKSDESETSEKKQKTESSETMDVDLEGKNPGNVIGGFKATLKNPNVSEEAREHAQQALDQLEGSETKADKKKEEEVDLSGKNKGNVVGGYKATVNNPNVSDEAKEHAKEVLEQLGEDSDAKSKDRSRGVSTKGKDYGHVIGGYKATLSNANSSEEAKEHARKVLKDFGVDENERVNEKDYSSSEADFKGKDYNHVIGGYKATLSNANSSEEAKAHAKRVLKELDVDPEERLAERDYSSTEVSTKGKNYNNVIGGYKATLSNGNSSEEAKEHARKVLKEFGVDENEKVNEKDSEVDLEGKNYNNVIGGYKATLSNANSSEEAKEHAKRVLEEFGVDPEERLTNEKDSSEKDQSHVIGGYKATLSNANSSEEAKEHARKMLKEMGASEEPVRHESSHETTVDGKNLGNVIGGYKAALHNENVSDEAKEEAKSRLAELGAKNSQ